ncbi:MAG: GNAT family N-acetyltransferase [Butyricicoccaceae bacterium]
MEIVLLNQEQVCELYETQMKRDFKQEELKPLTMILDSIASGLYRVYGLIEQDTCIAYATFLLERDSIWTLLDYFAVSPALRGSGVGTKFFRALMDENPATVLIEAEAVHCAENEADRRMRERRISFYEHCGCVSTEITTEVFGVVYSLLCYGAPAPLKHSTIRVKYLSLYHQMLKEKYDRCVKLLT